MLWRKDDIYDIFAHSKESKSNSQRQPNYPPNYSIGLYGAVGYSGLKLIFVTKLCTERQDKLFISPVKRLGSAVQRNRIKRLYREFYRHGKSQFREMAKSTALHAGQELLTENSWENLRNLEQKMVYHWAIVIYSEAKPYVPASIMECQLKDPEFHSWYPLAEFWTDAQNEAFLGELQRYQVAMQKLEVLMRKRWLHFVHQLRSGNLPKGKSWEGFSLS